ncbi:cytochrome P450 [Granulicella tundricola]|uniref:Cytochrome P450 n=1 Tax=Granulicella tundricola (strain ATCC BAA-1859 / DSM 23138 / MP5ACTX9) TaxID=1198114 RepID=E8WWY4_GRATM|nr:cytochrome P450 [Granulicella tundricola]ADW68545.1 cytochrome P450 [Granulicella tundricola MP5ACTX9]
MKGEWRMPPGLKRSLPFYAHKPWVKLGSPILLFEYLHETYGNIAHYQFMGTPIVFVNEPEYIREILVNQAGSFVKERTVKRMKILLGEGLITSEEPFHMRQRRIAAPAFHRQRINAYADQIVASAVTARERIVAGERFDIATASMGLSLEIVARTLFDTQVDDDIRRINDEVNTIMDLYNFIVAFPRIEMFLKLPIPGITRFRGAKARLDAVVDRLIEQRRKTVETEADRGDLLSMLLTSQDELLDADGKPTGEFVQMSDAQVRDEVLTIFLAGYETVANGLTWTWYLLSQNPEVEAKLHEELDRVLGVGDARRLPVLGDYAALRYTEMVFAESMRLYPPAWAMGRMSTKAVELGPYRIPPGAHFFFSQYMMSRTEEHYPDPLRFDPERFTAEAKAARAKFTYFPFGGGSRQCIGESFAWMEGVFSIATLAQCWRLRYADATPPEVQAKITLRPRDALHMVGERRV